MFLADIVRNLFVILYVFKHASELLACLINGTLQGHSFQGYFRFVWCRLLAVFVVVVVAFVLLFILFNI